MKEMIQKKWQEREGFTLAELLIVVAIIAVLVAIAIPIFTAQLEKSRDTTTVANLRTAYAEAQASYLSEVASNNDVTINKTNNKITSIAVKNVKAEGVQEGWEGNCNSDLPNGVTWNVDTMGGTAGNYTVTFTYAEDGTITTSCAA